MDHHESGRDNESITMIGAVPDGFPKRMFKFLHRDHVDGMLTRGIIRIGTAEEYRKPDGRTGARADSAEAVTNWQPGEGLHVIDKDHAFAQGLYPDGNLPGDKPIQLQTAAGTIFSMQANVYIYSASLEFTKYLKKRMAKEFDANACVRIDNLPEFFNAISSHEVLRPRNGEVNVVHYSDKPNLTDFAGTDAFHKSNEFRWQKEIRGIWGGKEIGDAGKIIQVPAITQFLSQVA